MADLERKGLLERREGSGNYVRHRAEVDSVYAMFRLELIGGGGLPTPRSFRRNVSMVAPSFPRRGTPIFAFADCAFWADSQRQLKRSGWTAHGSGRLARLI